MLWTRMIRPGCMDRPRLGVPDERSGIVRIMIIALCQRLFHRIIKLQV